MKPLKINLRLSLILICLLGQTSLWAAEKTIFTLTTFNIMFYGLHPDESRDPYLQTFLKESVPASDIIVFEEIVDVPRLKTILPQDWSCLSYENSNPGHQHVVICHSSRFNFVREATDDNDVIDEVAGPNGTLRPAVTAIVTDVKGNKLFRLVGVHLKASPDYSKTRVEQANIISNYLGKLKDSHLPIVIAGDFNTYKAPVNQDQVNDTELILKAFNANDLGLHHVENDLFTFRKSYGQGQFDQFYLSDSVNITKPLKIFDICNAATTTGEGLGNLEYYNLHISDHCPVSAEISL